jgi:transcriptional regulator with XRE-family HTH domain
MRAAINGDRLRRELMARGMDQAQFAEIAKLSPATISAAVRSREINPRTFQRIITALLRVPTLHGVEASGLLEIVAENRKVAV